MEKDKFFVDDKYRKNRLAHQDSSIRAEVYCEGKPIKVYTNIHFPNAFAKKVFKDDKTCIQIKFIDVSDNTEWTKKRDE